MFVLFKGFKEPQLPATRCSVATDDSLVGHTSALAVLRRAVEAGRQGHPPCKG